MAYFYKYNFISPEPIYAIIKEELKSYFDTGAVDDLLFPVYTNKCLEKLGRSSKPIIPTLLFVEDFQARLPDNFYAIREAWYCTWTDGGTYRSPNAYYSQTCNLDTVQVSPLVVGGECDSAKYQEVVCSNPICNDSTCDGGCLSQTVQAVYKTVENLPRQAFKRQFLLKPGNISMEENCDYNYNDITSLYGTAAQRPGQHVPHSADWDSFDIHDNKFVTTFRHGIVEVLMYASDFDNLGNQMIPDNFRIREYIEAFIKQKVFETLMNQTNDETFKQIESKYSLYKSQADEAYIMAEMEIKKQTMDQKQRAIRKNLKRFDKYELPTGRSSRNIRDRRIYRNNRYD
jgi:hypothetical protein